MDTVNTKKNIRFIDYYKALLMVLVVLGHINFANQGVKALIYAFHMPAFFFASGLLLKTEPPCDMASAGKMLWKKFKALLFPYFIWALIYSSLSGANLARILYGSHQTLIQAGSLSSLWFLPTLFMAIAAYILLQMIIGNSMNNHVRILSAAFAFCVAANLPKLKSGYPWCADTALTAFGFLMLGNLLCPFFRRLRNAAAATRKGRVLCVITLALSFAGTFLYRFNIPEGGNVLISEARYGNYGLFLLFGCIGTSFVLLAAILLDMLLPQRVDSHAPLSFLGKNTLPVFVLQKPIIHIFQQLFEKMPVGRAVALFVTCFAVLFMCCLIAMILNRFFPAAVGRA